MRASLRLAVAGSAAALLATTGAVSTTAAPTGGDLELTLVDTYATGVFDESASEIPAFDADTDRLFVVNANSGAVDVLQVASDGSPSYETTMYAGGRRAADGTTVDSGAVVNSVAVSRGRLAVAVQSADKTDHGWVLFFDTSSLDYLGGVRGGALPDSLAWNRSGRSVVVANEGEPADDFSADPEGTISVIDVPPNARTFHRLGQDDVTTIDFRAYDQGSALPEGVRVFGPDVPVPAGQESAGYVARNLEPEYVTVDPTGRTAFVSIQEANAVAVVDINRERLTDLWSLELSDWSQSALDVSNRDDAITLASWPILGVPMPDGLASYRYRGQNLVVTANEGDSREWGDFVDAERVKDLDLCPSAFPDADDLTEDENLGRLNVLTDLGYDADGDCYDELYALGGRSFSIYTEDGQQLFDSAGIIEAKIAELIVAGELPEHAFNANNDETPSFDSRSDDKGPEPEDVEIGEVDGRTYAFVGLERIGGAMVFDITDPGAVGYVDYVNNRAWDVEGDDGVGMGDLGAEGLEFVPAQDSPSGEALLVISNEVSGSTTVYEVAPGR